MPSQQVNSLDYPIFRLGDFNHLVIVPPYANVVEIASVISNIFNHRLPDHPVLSMDIASVMPNEVTKMLEVLPRLTVHFTFVDNTVKLDATVWNMYTKTKLFVEADEYILSQVSIQDCSKDLASLLWR